MTTAEREALRDFVLATIRSEVTRAISSLETRSGPIGERGEPGPAGPSGEAGPQGEPGKDGADGVGIRSAEQRGGDLILTLTDGTEHNVGRVVGEQGPQGERGADGSNGRDGAPGERGERGERGEDGIASREEIEALVDARFADVQTRTLADTYRGVWKAGEKYRRGETATWGGSLFLALSDTGGKPTETTDWQQITKRGRDGRDAR